MASLSDETIATQARDGASAPVVSQGMPDLHEDKPSLLLRLPVELEQSILDFAMLLPGPAEGEIDLDGDSLSALFASSPILYPIMTAWLRSPTMKTTKHHVRFQFQCLASIAKLVQHAPKSIINSVNKLVLDMSNKTPSSLTAADFDTLIAFPNLASLDLIVKDPAD